jgi:hypothetical protein
MSQQIQLTDDLLLRALKQRMQHVPSATLLSRISAATATAPQIRQRRGWLRGGGAVGRPRWSTVPALAGATAVLVAAILVVAALRPVITGPGATTAPSPTPSIQPSPTTSAQRTAEPRLLGDTQALRLRLGINTAPIDVTEAFGSIWIADIHANDVRRFDPATMEELARIHVPGGPAWFAVAGDAMWVSTQLANGLTRIDPATNTAAAAVGDDPPCTAPVVFLGSIWQSACDGDAFLRVDPSTNKLIARIPAEGHVSLVLAGNQLITSGPEGLARLDPDTGAITAIGPSASKGGLLAGSDGVTVWFVNAAGAVRIDPADGHTIASISQAGANEFMTFSGGHAWLTTTLGGVVEIDLATNTVVGTIPVPGSPLVARELAGVLWVTDLDNDDLWRVVP